MLQFATGVLLHIVWNGYALELQINVLVGKYVKINKCTGQDKDVLVWKIAKNNEPTGMFIISSRVVTLSMF